MINAVRTRAESRFEAIEKRQRKILDEQDEAAAALRKNTERLKALRLAKAESDRVEAMIKKVAEKRKAKVRKPRQTAARKAEEAAANAVAAE